MSRKIVGVFASDQDASNAVRDLQDLGYRAEDISVIGKNKDDVNAIHEETGTKAPEGIASGAATGGVLGGLAGLLAGIGALAIPGIGPIVAAGPIAATLTGAAVGAGAGGLVGGLVGLGIPEDEAEEYNTFVKHGRILVMVDAEDAQERSVYSLFRNHHSLNAHNYRDHVEQGMNNHSERISTDSDIRERREIRESRETREPAGAFYQELPEMDRNHSDINYPEKGRSTSDRTGKARVQNDLLRDDDTKLL